mmetsp:Transcript_164632/g.400218  ORF Transcript_164632/g.400218 Transcript_164632/m.400218 type:complete len:215 (+) Transcript_164632:418-1062(+)
MQPAQAQHHWLFPSHLPLWSLTIHWACPQEAPRPVWKAVPSMELRPTRRMRHTIIPLVANASLGVSLRMHGWTPLIAGPSRKAALALVMVSVLLAMLGLKAHSCHQPSQSLEFCLPRQTTQRWDQQRCPVVAQLVTQLEVASRARSSTRTAARTAWLAPSATCAGLTRGSPDGKPSWRLGEQEGSGEPEAKSQPRTCRIRRPSFEARSQGGCKP